MNPNQSDIPTRLSSEEMDRVFEVTLSLIPAAETLARKCHLSSDIARDAMMEAAKRVIQRADNLGSIGNLPGYLFTVGRNLIRAESKRKKVEVSIDEAREGGIDEAQNKFVKRAASDPTKAIENELLLSEIVRRMGPRERAIFNYRRLGFTYEEIASKLGHRTTPATLRSDLSKAYKRIIKELEEAGAFQ